MQKFVVSVQIFLWEFITGYRFRNEYEVWIKKVENYIFY